VRFWPLFRDALMRYIVDDGETIGDSDTIIAYLIAKYRLTTDAKLTGAERDTDHLITRIRAIARAAPTRRRRCARAGTARPRAAGTRTPFRP
jgi:hypothetical protein